MKHFAVLFHHEVPGSFPGVKKTLGWTENWEEKRKEKSKEERRKKKGRRGKAVEQDV